MNQIKKKPLISVARMSGRMICALGLMAFAAGQIAAASSSVITTNSIATGRFATPCYIHDTGKTGPTVMIVGGAHGNEPAGAAAAETIRHWPLTKGRLVVVPRANVPALEAGKRLTPNLETNLNNLNRNYPRAGQSESPRGEIAEAIWSLALQSKPDWLLDLHEGYDFNQINNKSVGSSVICFSNDQSRVAADLMLAAVNATIPEEKLKFLRRDLPVDGSLSRAGGEHLKIPSLTLETTSKQPMEMRVRQHEIMVHTLLKQLGMMSSALPAATYVALQNPPKSSLRNAEGQNLIRVALYKGPGTGGQGPPSLMKKLNNTPSSTIMQLSPEDICRGALTNFDVVIFGGGSGSKQAESIGEPGREAVRTFVANGGGYVGICAGAYLATSGYSWSLGLVNARTVSPKWRRGKARINLELTEPGTQVLGERKGQFDCLYANGPIVTPDTKTNLPKFETLAYFRTEVSSNDAPVGVMINSPAIFRGEYHRGRVICVSPHPEQTSGLEDIIPNAVNWVAPRERAVANKPLPRAE